MPHGRRWTSPGQARRGQWFTIRAGSLFETAVSCVIFSPTAGTDNALTDEIAQDFGVDWHRLLAPLPRETQVKSRPVASPELAATTDVSAIAGWQQLTCELSAGEAGLRHLLVVLDQTGRPISAGDHVLRCLPADGGLTRYEHESVGGRLEEDGTFRGTWHRTVFLRSEDSDDEIPPIESASRPPTPDETASLRSLVSEILARALRVESVTQSGDG